MSIKCESCKWFEKYKCEGGSFSLCTYFDGRVKGDSKIAKTCKHFKHLKMQPNKRLVKIKVK